MTKYRADPVYRHSLFNYKIDALIGESQAWLLTVLDTGDEPNLIRTASLDFNLLQTIDTSTEVFNLASASNHKLDLRGIIHLMVTVGTQANRAPFAVVDRLGADDILELTYINQAIENIKCQRRVVLFLNRNFVLMVRRNSAASIRNCIPEKKMLSYRTNTHLYALHFSI